MSIKQVIKIMNPSGLHARPASIFVRIANRFQSEIWVSKDGERINGKSMMNILTLAAEEGSEVELDIDGIDENEAMKALSDFLQSKEEGV